MAAIAKRLQNVRATQLQKAQPSHYIFYMLRRALGGKDESHYNIVKRRLLNVSSLQSKLRTLGIHVADDATVDDPGCVYTHPLWGIW